MKNFFGLFLSFLLLCANGVFAQQVSGNYMDVEEETEQEIAADPVYNKDCGGSLKPLVYAGFTNYPPFGWVEAFSTTTDEFTYESRGLALTLLQKLASEMGLTIRDAGVKSYKEALRALDQGRIDLLLGSYYDGDPYTHADYVFPAYSNNPFVLVSLKGKMIPVTGWDDLKGKKVALRKEENLWPLIENVVPAEIQFEMVAGARNAFKLLINKEVDFLLSSRYAVETEIARFKLANFVDLSEKPLKEPKLFFSFNKDSRCAVYKKEFGERLAKLANNKDYMSDILNSTIKEWKEKFKDEPSLLIKEGFEMTDDMAAFFQDEDDDEAESRKKKRSTLDVNTLVNSLLAPAQSAKPEEAPSGEKAMGSEEEIENRD